MIQFGRWDLFLQCAAPPGTSKDTKGHTGLLEGEFIRTTEQDSWRIFYNESHDCWVCLPGGRWWSRLPAAVCRSWFSGSNSVVRAPMKMLPLRKFKLSMQPSLTAAAETTETGL
ncbi:MAG: hypothetical protein M1834_001068 [Cirrosporium novae-zelandiae]|nr:MAG: hypothetical protein M1834_001068 [Cirrosporium novae-zelandiae]